MVYLAIAVPVCLFFVWNDDVNSMEGIIALGARHMLESGEWIVPKLYGEVYAFKPALAYWLAAIPEALLGYQTELSLRLPTALCGLTLGLALCLSLGTWITPQCGLWCALAATTSGLFVEQVRAATFDMPLTLGTGVAVVAACRNLAFEKPSWRWWLLGYAGLSFGFLAKGVPAIAVYAPGLVVAGLVLGRFRDLLRPAHLTGVGLFTAIVLVYVYLAYRAEGRSAFVDPLTELAFRSHGLSLLGTVERIVRPVVIFVAFLPFSLILVVERRVPGRGRLPAPAPQIGRAAWAFLLAGIGVFLLVSDCETRYYLPLVVPTAILCGLAAESLSSRPSGPPADERSASDSRQARDRRLRWLAGPGVPVVLLGIALVYWGVYAGVVQPRRIAKRSERRVAEAFAPYLPESVTVYLDAGDSGSSLCYYLNRPVRAWDLSDDSPSAPSYFILSDDQAGSTQKRSDTHYTPVARARGPGRSVYHLVVLQQRIPPVTTAPASPPSNDRHERESGDAARTPRGKDR